MNLDIIESLSDIYLIFICVLFHGRVLVSIQELVYVRHVEDDSWPLKSSIKKLTANKKSKVISYNFTSKKTSKKSGLALAA